MTKPTPKKAQAAKPTSKRATRPAARGRKGDVVVVERQLPEVRAALLDSLRCRAASGLCPGAPFDALVWEGWSWVRPLPADAASLVFVDDDMPPMDTPPVDAYADDLAMPDQADEAAGLPPDSADASATGASGSPPAKAPRPRFEPPPFPPRHKGVIPRTDDGAPDYDALADMARDDIATERQWAWECVRGKDAHDGSKVYDPGHTDAPPLLEPWAAMHPERLPVERPDLFTMHEKRKRNQLGDAELFRLRAEGLFMYDWSRGKEGKGEWMQYDGICWKPDEQHDVMGEDVGVMAVADWYDSAVSEQIAEGQDKIIKACARVLEKMQAENADEEAITRAQESETRLLRKYNSTLVDALERRASGMRTRSRASEVLAVAANGCRALSTTGKEWDVNPMVLACPNGIVDLETGRLMRARPSQMITRRAAFEYRGLSTCTARWEAHLHKVLCGDLALIDYFGRVMGYSATGLMDKKEMYCLWGPTADNAKSATMAAITATLGEYARSVKVNVLLEDGQKGSGPNPELLALNGPRLAVASEPKRSASFALEMIKAITGGDEINERGLYADALPFKPRCKLCMHTNFIPNIKDADRAFQKRLRVLPFKAQFVTDGALVDESRYIYKAVPGLLAKSMDQYGPEILAWLVRHARQYLRDQDLTPPRVVAELTKDVIEDQDLIGEFVGFCCEVGEDRKEQAKNLHRAFRNWCIKEKDMQEKHVMNHKAFGSLMLQRPEFERRKTNGVYWYHGLCPRDQWLKLDEGNTE
ncbi:DNA primase family protein [Nitratidesulfovibrio sp. 1201_IL3209]|uniref:DNA primase family protein n=1 Tax=Nitratidesulfovibrio sp. 1201_IL3209 TaxID=3084053 RepID=UPI002FDB72D5